jgi:hypothetical protein
MSDRKAIWKYPLDMCERQTIKMPQGARPLCVQLQGSIPTMWALVDSNAALVLREFVIHGTGHQDINDLTEKYIGTWQQGVFVW